eukprot:TRINITY_DN7760_c0_g1_i1.p1 TRINITY_DN7760_c0_g1~~TRINITY_DN7760_c0_g1_i1.p1  ORF type:complete len:283 (+),score=34.28 TRINITY_DN7760_c0_g1_i1:46-849(+)
MAYRASTFVLATSAFFNIALVDVFALKSACDGSFAIQEELAMSSMEASVTGTSLQKRAGESPALKAVELETAENENKDEEQDREANDNRESKESLPHKDCRKRWKGLQSRINELFERNGVSSQDKASEVAVVRGAEASGDASSAATDLRVIESCINAILEADGETPLQHDRQGDKEDLTFLNLWWGWVTKVIDDRPCDYFEAFAKLERILETNTQDSMRISPLRERTILHTPLRKSHRLLFRLQKVRLMAHLRLKENRLCHPWKQAS